MGVARGLHGITQPDTLRAMLRAVRRYQPRELVVTGGSGAAETDEVFRVGGLMDVVESEGAIFHLWEAARLGIGESSTDEMAFPAMSLREGIEAFTEAAYGQRLTFDHE